MKKYMRFSIVVVAMVMLLSMTSVYVSAANTTPETIGYEIFVDGRALIPREKDDATAHYFYVSSSTYSVMQISSFGLSNFFDSYDQDQNTTRSNGQYVHHVACRVGTKYSIVNRVYEDGYPWATLFVADYYSPAGGHIQGEWSPDSTVAYTIASPNL